MVKPLADICAATILLILLSPLIASLILLLAIINRGNIFFLQQRPGLNAKPFYIIKFKTMRDEFDKKGNPLPDEIRLTELGKFIRSLSLDELLQLINVVKGEMSLVGPRPLLMKYLIRYNEEQNQRHLVKPGITGLAQVNGRNELSWEEKFKLDVKYVRDQSFILDLVIIYKTLISLIKRKGINADGKATTDEFMGNLN